jgi:hypothetical protein
MAALKRETAAADACGEVVANPFEVLDLFLEYLLPAHRNRAPVFFAGRAPRRQIVERFLDRYQWDSDALRGSDKGETTQNISAVSALVAGVTDA